MSLTEKYPQEVEKILAKYPPEQKRSAVMPLLYLAQRQEAGVVYGPPAHAPACHVTQAAGNKE